MLINTVNSQMAPPRDKAGTARLHNVVPISHFCQRYLMGHLVWTVSFVSFSGQLLRSPGVSKIGIESCITTNTERATKRPTSHHQSEPGPCASAEPVRSYSALITTAQKATLERTVNTPLSTSRHNSLTCEPHTHTPHTHAQPHLRRCTPAKASEPDRQG